MSEENAAIVRKLAESFQRRDHELAFEYYDPEIEWDATGGLRREDGSGVVASDLAGIYHGHEGVRTFWRRWLEAWRDLEFEVEDIRAAGDEVVMLVDNQRQWGRHSGIETRIGSYAMVFTFGGGKVVRWRTVPDQKAALKAAGLLGEPR